MIFLTDHRPKCNTALALALAVKLNLLYFEFCDIDRARLVRTLSTFVTTFRVGLIEDDALKVRCFKEYSQLLNSAFRSITRRSTRS